ncbi:MAG: hypothetical protein IJ163_10405 [Bacteroidaceae bacterium]|nr:hypothetical protein [Bacteroidaceae bacterium]
MSKIQINPFHPFHPALSAMFFNLRPDGFFPSEAVFPQLQAGLFPKGLFQKNTPGF